MLAQGLDSPLALLDIKNGDKPLFAFEEAVFAIGFVGLAEFVLLHTATELHTSEKAQRFAVKTLERLRQTLRGCERAHGIKLRIIQSHAETTAHRFARLDLGRFSPTSGRLVRGSISDGGVYYSNSSHISVSAKISPLERALLEGNMHESKDLEATTQIHLAEGFVATARVIRFLKDVFVKTHCRQILLSPEFAFCQCCGRLLVSGSALCGNCAAEAKDVIARITRYYSPLSAWNIGKRAEFVEGVRHNDYFLNAE